MIKGILETSWENYIKKWNNYTEIWSDDLNCIHMAQHFIVVWKYVEHKIHWWAIFGVEDKLQFNLLLSVPTCVSSQVDLNPEYECLAVRSQDEEEKYFDSETPECVANEGGSDEEKEDELDVYMKNLKPDPTPSDLAGNLSVVL